MRFTTSAVVAVLATQATATFWNVNADSYTSPANRDNKCDDKQKGGYDFEDLNPDDDVGEYGGNQFSGFKCKKSPFSKRTFGLGKKSFGGSKCISGTVDSGSGPSFGGYAQGFSVKGMKLSVDFDTDVDAYFDMPGGKTCKQTISCKTGGTDYTNKQCGGATKVRFQLPKKSGKKCGLNVHRIDFDCNPKSKDVPKKTPTGYKSSTADVPSNTKPVGTPTGYTPSQGTPTGYVPSQGTPTNTYASSSPSSPASSTLSTVPIASTTGNAPPSSAPSSAPSSSYSAPPSPPVGQYPSTSVPVPSSSTTANAPSGPSTGVPVPYPSPSTPGSSAPSSAPPASSTTANAPSGPSTGVPVPYPSPSTPGASAPSSAPPASSTTANAPSGPSTGVPVPYPSTTAPGSTAPASSSTANAPSGPSTGVPAPYPSPSQPVGQYPSQPASSSTADAPTGPSSGVPSYAPTSSAPAPSSPAAPPAGCPGIVPSCLNTWMWESGCANNADASCYCKSKDFIEDVMDCIGSWGDDCEEQSKAANYLIGICADYVKDNSALVTAVPKCEASPETPDTPGKTITYKSTVDVTITSCAPTVTDCPAKSTVVTNTVITTSSVVVPSSPAQQYPSNTGSAPAPYPTTANAPSGPAPSVPVTTIPYTSVVTIPQTYSTGAESGSPSAPVYSTIATTLTVPYVSFSTAPVTPGQTPSVGLYQPIPNPNATPTGKATNPVPGVPTGTGLYTTGRSPSATRPVSYTGAADKHAVGYVAAAVAIGAWFF
ncbi:Hypothetical protein D9617_10g072300 [Elsinoe fawcettii]|nr:Hypothetical protein D9617_10g072300 [Elsinoe fawcettii]